MAYTAGDTILDDHYNDFATSVNALWGTGTGVRGYGQSSTVSSVSAGATITATQWTTLLNRIRSISDHVGDDASITIDTVTNPTGGDTIAAYTTLTSDIATIDGSAALADNAAGFGTSITNAVSTSGTFTVQITQESRLTFAGGNEARWFFNAGGRIGVSWSISGGTADGKYNEWSDLCTQAGTFYTYANTSGKSGGSGTATTNNTNYGYYDATTSYVEVFKQFADTSPYTANYLALQTRVGAADGDGLGNNGAYIEFNSLWVDDAADQTSFDKAIYNVLDQVDGTKTTTFSADPPATTFISNTWGTPVWSTITNTES